MHGGGDGGGGSSVSLLRKGRESGHSGGDLSFFFNLIKENEKHKIK